VVPPPQKKAVTRAAPPPPPTTTTEYKVGYSGRYDLKPRDNERIQTPQFQIGYPTNMPRSSKEEKKTMVSSSVYLYTCIHT
jgi:hypothetical protein